MKRFVLRRVSYAQVVASLALFVALGGSSYAAIAVTGKDVKNGSLTGVDIKNSSLTSADIKDRSLLAQDFKLGQLPAGARGATGAQGPKGETGAPGAAGAQGAAGAAGSPGVSGYEVVTSGIFTNAPNHQDFGSVFCPPGKHALGGGVATNATIQTEQAVAGSYPTTDGTGWTAYVNNLSAMTRTFGIRVICGVVQ